MVTICQRGGVMNPILRQALKRVVEKCTSFASTGRPLNSRKVSFGNMLTHFNDHLQVDFFFVEELDNDPILHMVDYHTGLSATALGASRSMDDTSRAFEMKWINVHGPPSAVSADLEFFNAKFVNSLRYFGVDIQPKPARRHHKMGVVERKHTSIRLLVQRIIRDAKYFSLHRSTSYDKDEILSRATYLSNVLYGSKTLSSFEMARGYTPSIAGLPQCTLSEQLIEAHEEQVSRRALKKLDRSRNPHTIDPIEFPANRAVYYFKRDNKFGKWMVGYVRKAEPHFVTISSRKDHRGKPIRAAYEYVRLVPTSSLLREMDEVQFIFPRSYSVVDEDFELQQDQSVPLPSPFPPPSSAEDSKEANSIPTPLDEQEDSQREAIAIPQDRKDDEDEDLSDLELDATHVVEHMIESEASLWSKHVSFCNSFLSTSSSIRPRVNLPALDIGSHLANKFRSMLGFWRPSAQQSKDDDSSNNNNIDITMAHDPPHESRDIGGVEVCEPDHIPFSLSSSEQEELQKLMNTVGMSQLRNSTSSPCPDGSMINPSMQRRRHMKVVLISK